MINTTAPISAAVVMNDAWRIARAAAAKFGCRVRYFIGPALRQAWAAARKPLWTAKPERWLGLSEQARVRDKWTAAG